VIFAEARAADGRLVAESEAKTRAKATKRLSQKARDHLKDVIYSELSDKSHAEIARKHGIETERLEEILTEGVMNHWPDPFLDNSPWAAKAKQESEAPGTAGFVGVGEGAVLVVPKSSQVWLAVDDAWDEMIDAENAQDYEEMNILIGRGRVVRTPSGTRAKVIKRGFTSCKVRLRDGTVPGFEGWIQTEFVRPASQ
jgi:hypothetical protein